LPLVDEAAGQPLVLIVDDDSDLCLSLSDLFQEHGLRACLAHDIGAAEQRLRKAEYQVVLIDLRLPHGNGAQVFDLVRRINPQARTVLITGHRWEMSELVEQIQAAGADAVCYKPFDVPRLVAMVQGLAG
jgi:two-component system response regulator PilR (NtrC family)